MSQSINKLSSIKAFGAGFYFSKDKISGDLKQAGHPGSLGGKPSLPK